MSTLNSNSVLHEHFILLSGNYGTGKTYSSIYACNASNKVPIILNPVEEGNIDDVLYLFYREIKKRTKNKAPSTNSLSIFVFIILFFIAINLFDKLRKVTDGFIYFFEEHLLPQLVQEFQGINIQQYEISSLIKFFAPIILMVITFLMVKKSIPMIIPLYKNSTKYFRDFYLDSINKFLQDRFQENYILIIEDIDRLEDSEIEKIFRIINTINQNVKFNYKKVAGILSYDVKNMKSENVNPWEEKIICSKINNEDANSLGEYYKLTRAFIYNKLYVFCTTPSKRKIDEIIKEFDGKSNISYREIHKMKQKILSLIKEDEYIESMPGPMSIKRTHLIS